MEKGDIMDTVIAEFYRVENEVIRELLKKCLGREPVLEDGKRLTKAIRENQDSLPYAYEIGFDGTMIGYIFYDFGPEKYGVRFEPNDTFKV